MPSDSRLFNEVNRERVAKRKPGLVRNTQLDEEAQRHSERMANGRVSFSHRGFKDRAKRLQRELPLSKVAENLARNQGFSDPVSTAVAGWMKSKGHRKNLLGDFDVTGIGIAEARDGTVYFTQLFGKENPRS